MPARTGGTGSTRSLASQGTLDRRPRWLAVVLVIALVGVGAKLVDLQVLDPTRYREHSYNQRVVNVTLAAERGVIYDRNGAALALSVERQSVYVDPGMVEDPATAAPAVAQVLDLDVDAVTEAMEAPGRFAYLARQVPDHVADEVRALDLPGVALVGEPTRILPGGDLARSIVGMTDIDSVGISGLEAQYADQLTGTRGSFRSERGPDGRTIPVGEQVFVPAVAGDDLVLTLDRAVQFEAERFLAEQVDAAGAAGGVVVVSVPGTGEIVALANVDRDPTTGEVTVSANNQAVTTSYEPGSVMKALTVAGAMEDGVVSHTTELVVPDAITLGEWEFTEHSPHGTVTWGMPSILANSSNTGTIQVAQMMGADRLHHYLGEFGLGAPTALGFPNEQAGNVPPLTEWWDSSIGSIPIGQSAAVTPLQMLLAYNVIANGGVYVPARLVDATVDGNGQRHDLPAGEARQVLSEDTADAMNMMLRGVIAVGTGTRAAVEGYTVAGKTGTSRKPLPGGGYGDPAGGGNYQATFVGFVPASSPALSILVMIDEPTAGDIYGGSLAAPVFSRVAESALRILDIPPPATDRAARFVDALPVEAREPGTTTGGTGSRALSPTVLPGPDGRIRAQPVATPVAASPGPAPE